ncbi:MAG TPA: hypothetical protein VNJ07_12685 [Chitinophagales bacterium]|nr:hypothetical protein [Chitinophagales bacterium]
MLLISISMLILGILIGCCLYRFCENGMISKREASYRRHENSFFNLQK